MFCYVASSKYELGYVKKHVKNMPLYEFIKGTYGIYTLCKEGDDERAVILKTLERMNVRILK